MSLTALDIALPDIAVLRVHGMMALVVMPNTPNTFKLVRSSVGQISRRIRI